ncbi:gp436 family protein [Leptolyngbyaceae cyanobacterium UHCC 1019]
MPYATQQQFIDAFGRDEAIQLTNLEDSTAEEIDVVPLNRALTDASSMIDTYLGGKYTVPFTTVPAVLIPHCLNIARYYLDRNSAREDVRQRYEDAIRWLEQLAKGILTLGLDTAQATIKPREGLPDFTAGEKVYTNSSLQDFGSL